MMNIMPQSEEEMAAIREAVVSSDGLLLSVFDVLRRVPRRVLMVLKLNDLTRLALIVTFRMIINGSLFTGT
jgi:aarF domain-containing kinase